MADPRVTRILDVVHALPPAATVADLPVRTPIPTEHAALVDYLRDLPDRDRGPVADRLAAQLRDAGHPDPFAAAHKMMKNATAELQAAEAGPIPADIGGLISYLTPMPPHERVFVAERLAAQLGGSSAAVERAADMVETALRDIEWGERSARAAQRFGRTLDTLVYDVEAAQRELDKLVDGDNAHVEYEGRDGADMASYLDDARRALRAAAALNPCKPATPGGAG